jgi:hypothetical protein
MLLTGLLRARVECDVRVRDVSHVDVPDSNRIGCASFELPADAILATMLESIRKGGLPLEVLGETRPQLDLTSGRVPPTARLFVTGGGPASARKPYPRP